MKEKQRVALYLPLGKKRRPWNGLGGAEKRLSYLISHMNEKDYQLSIVLRIYDENEKAVNAINDYISEYCNVVILHSNAQVFKHFQKEKYNYVLYADGMVMTIPGAIGAMLGGSKRILLFVTEYYARWDFKKKWHSLIMRINGLLCSSIDTLYPSTKGILEKKFKNRKVSITPCSLPYFEEYIKKGVISEKQNKIVFAARLIDSKNPMMLLDTAKDINDILYDKRYEIVICGDGPLRTSIIDRIESNGLRDVVSFVGTKSMLDVLPSSLIFVSLQDNENYPSQSLLEAIASGCICIATNVGETELIVQKDFGYLIEKNKTALSNAILETIDMCNEDKRIASARAIQFAEKTFQPQRAIEHYEMLCK